MKRIPSDETILRLLDQLNHSQAEDLESEVLDFKRWEDAKKSLGVAIEMPVCFANAEGGLVVFGVKDQVKGRSRAVTGCERYDLDVWRRGIYDGSRPHLTADVSRYEADEHTVKLTIYDGSFDEVLAAFIASRQRAGDEFDLVSLLILSYLREHAEVDISTAARLCQLPETAIRDRLERISLNRDPWLERRGRKSGVTYHLSRSVAAEFLGKGVYSRSRAIDQVQWPALIRRYVEEHGSVNNSECRELLLLGNSRSARSTVSRLLAALDFLESYGTSPKTTRYRLNKNP